MAAHAIAILLHQAPQPLMQCNACCKCENDSRCSHSLVPGALVGKMATLRQAG